MKNRRFVIRPAAGQHPSLMTAAGRAGIWSWDPATATYERLRTLVYAQSANGDDAGLAGMEDRIVVQGETFLEFDAVTMRLLRRYHAVASEHDQWGFRGPLVTEGMAKELGIPAGYYGILYCPADWGSIGWGCRNMIEGAVVFQGLPSDLIFRRSVRPEEPRASLMRAVPTTDTRFMRHLTLDQKRARFWFWHREPIGSLLIRERFGFMPISGGTIGDEVVVSTTDRGPGAAEARSPRAMFFDTPSDSVLTKWRPQSGSWYASRVPADLSGPETIIDPDGPNAMTNLAPGLPETYEQVLPAIGKAAGANGTFWRSDVWIYNPSSSATSVTVRRVAQPQSSRTFDLPPHGSLELPDALGLLGGGTLSDGGDGVTTDALVIVSPYRWGEQLTVYSRTYTSTTGGTGTYGQAVPAVPGREGYSNHLRHGGGVRDVDAGRPEFYLDMRTLGRFRHNLGAVNDSSEPLEVRLYHGINFPPSASPTTTVTVPPRSVLNVNLESLLRDHLSVDRVSSITVAASRPAPVWMSMVDNRTGDATFLPFTMLSLWGASDSTLPVPQIARTPGAAGTYWRTDLYAKFAPPIDGGTALPPATFVPSDVAACGGRSRVETTLIGPSGQPGVEVSTSVGSGARRVFPDAVSQFGCSGTGALEMTVGTWMTGFTRTYTTREDGGTYGEMLPFYPASGWPVQHFSGIKVDPSTRINIGLYNALDYPVVHRLVLFDKAGEKVASRDVELAPKQSLQAPLASLVGAVGAGLHGLSVVPLDAPSRPGRSWAYVSIVDNMTGDPINLW